MAKFSSTGALPGSSAIGPGPVPITLGSSSFVCSESLLRPACSSMNKSCSVIGAAVHESMTTVLTKLTGCADGTALYKPLISSDTEAAPK